MNKKGQVTIYITFIIIALIIVTIAGVLAPMGVEFNTRMYEEAEEIFLRANESIADIDNAEVRTRVYAMIDQALDSQENNIEVNSDIFQYSWVIVLGLTGIIIFLYTRRVIEFSGGGFV